MTTELSTTISAEQLAELKALNPQGDSFQRINVPRLGMLAKDLTEETGTGKSKKIDVIQPAGAFYIERETTNEDGERVWEKEFIDGETIDVLVAFNRKQLSMWDDGAKVFTNSPIYDEDTQVIPLWEGGKEIAKATPKELQEMYPALTAKGKPTSKLKEVKILYVIYKDEVYQMNLSQSSKYEFLTYVKGVHPSTVVTVIGSKEQTHGSNTYNVMTFKNAGTVNMEQYEAIKSTATMIKEAIEAEKAYYAKFDTNVPVTASIEEDWSPDAVKGLQSGSQDF